MVHMVHRTTANVAPCVNADDTYCSYNENDYTRKNKLKSIPNSGSVVYDWFKRLYSPIWRRM